MLSSLKAKLYFPLASYFRFFAGIRLRRWKPRIVVVTGSSGKTTLLHMLESQFGDKAKYSHHANSSYGIPFDILDLHRKTLKSSEWVSLFLRAPLQAFKKPFEEKIYVVEADVDRPGEGKFLAAFLKPEVVLWVSVSRTHGVNFDRLVNKSPQPIRPELTVEGPPLRKGGVPQDGGFNSVDEAIAHEFGHFVAHCSKLAVIDGDSELEVKQAHRTKAKVTAVKRKHDLTEYRVDKHGTTFIIDGKRYSFEALLPEEVFYSIVMCRDAVEYFGLPFDRSFSEFSIPPGRGTLLQGIQQSVLIDSSYNANLSSMQATLEMFGKYPATKKWVVLGDMLELGEKEQEEHEKLAEVLSRIDLEQIILVGKRVSRYTFAKLKGPTFIMSFEEQKDVLVYLQKNIKGGEAILFKGSQSLFLEGIIEQLLQDKNDATKLPRRGEFWSYKREKLGL